MWNQLSVKNKNFILLLFIILIVFLFMKYAFLYLLPFVLGIGIVIIFNPMLRGIKKRLRLGKGLVMGIILFITGCISGFLLFLIVKYVIQNIKTLENSYSVFQKQLDQCMHNCCDAIGKSTNIDKNKILSICKEGLCYLGDKFQIDVLPDLMSKCFYIIKWLGILGAMWAVLIIFCMMFAKDYDIIRIQLNKYSWFHSFYKISSKIFHMLTSYFCTQGIILLVIWVVVALGTLTLGYKHFILIGFCISLLEAIPFIGTGITLIPMGLWQLINGSPWKALGCLILYGVCVFIREFLEPKILGKRVGMHPIIMLVAIYLGVQLFGLIGILTGPVSYLIISETYQVIKIKV